jgi:hypothetical protein
MSHNSFGHLFRVTTWGESHGPAIGCVVDGAPPRLRLDEADIQRDLDRRRPGQSRFTTQRREPDRVRILSGVLDGLTTGTPIALQIENEDARSKDYGEIAAKFRPGHADYAYWRKYGIRDHRGGGSSSARETASPRVPWRARFWARMSPSAARSSSSAATGSTAPDGTGRPSARIRSSVRTGRPRRPGKANWTLCARPGPRSAP